jgi:guanine nucleotide-binding protein subunit alpha
MKTKFWSKKLLGEHAAYADVLEDPFAQALLPPKDESPEDRAVRLERQEEEVRISQAIDESLQESKIAYRDRKNATKILLLGESLQPWATAIGTVLRFYVIKRIAYQARLNRGKVPC